MRPWGLPSPPGHRTIASASRGTLRVSVLDPRVLPNLPRTRKKSPKLPVPYLTQPSQITELASNLAEQQVIAFDTEFLWERSYSPQLALIQVSDGQSSWVVDPLALSQDDLQPLLDVLVSERPLKVAHAVDQDQMCLHLSYGIVAEPVMDTATAAALTGMGDQIGLSTLLENLLQVGISKGYSRTNWLKRPLPVEMLQYAAEDVAHLPRAAEVLVERLQRLGRAEWAMDLSAKAGRFAETHFEPAALAKRIAENRRLDATTFGVLRELITWREAEARRLDIPRRWVAEDKVLVKLAGARPKTAKQLGDFRGIGGVNNPRAAERILSAMRTGLAAPTDGYTKPPRKRSPTAKEAAAVIVLRCFLNALAAEHGIPLRLLIHSDNMVELLRGRFTGVDSLRESGLLEPRAVDLVGQDLIQILNGQRSLRLVNGAAEHVRNEREPSAPRGH